MTTTLFDLNDKIALVTGASRGIGEEVAKLLAQQGAHVIISSRNQDACEKVAQDINDNGGQASAYACHIGELEQIEAIFNYIKHAAGNVFILTKMQCPGDWYICISQ